MAALGLMPTHCGTVEDVNTVQVSIHAANFLAYPHRINNQLGAFTTMPIQGLLGKTASVQLYPYTMSFGQRRSIGNRGNLGRNTKSIRGLAQNPAATGIQRHIYAVYAGGDGLGTVIGHTESSISTGIFDLRVQDDQPVLIFMKSNDGETKNDVILEDILPVAPV